MTAVALAVVRTLIEQEIPAQAAAKGEHLSAKLRSLENRHPAIAEVRGQGLLIGIEFGEEIAAEVVSACRERGLLCSNLKANVIRLAPPLTIAEEDLDHVAEILDAALTAVAEGS